MPFYLEMSKNITKQRDIYDTVIFRFLQIFYGLYVFIQSSPNLKVFLSQVENKLFSIADVLNENKRHSNLSKEE